MRKLNSAYKTAFLSEAGSGLENNDYFAYVELGQYACYVLADGLSDLPDAKSAKAAIEAAILAFEGRPSLGKGAVRSYIQAANAALVSPDNRERLKASVVVVVSDYAQIRYACAGNARLRLYRDGAVRGQSQDTSLGRELADAEKIPADALARHEERNNLYAYVGQGKGFVPFVSGKTKLAAGDILALYTRGIWENLDNGELDDVFFGASDDPQECLDNLEDMLLSKQPGNLENYTAVAIFVDKVFQDPKRRKKVAKIAIVCVAALVICVLIGVAAWLFGRFRARQAQALEQGYSDTVEYIRDGNFVKAAGPCQEALDAAGKLQDRGRAAELSEYMKLIDAVNAADGQYDQKKYQEAQDAYVTAKARSRHADHVADAYIDKRLAAITDYLSVFDYIQMGDTLAAQGDYARAEEKYTLARDLATGAYFEEGRKEALAALQAVYAERDKAQAEEAQAVKAQAVAETGAAELMAQGDKAFGDKDYEGAKAFYAMAMEKYQALGDSARVGTLDTKIQASAQKLEEIKAKEAQAEGHVAAAKELEAAKGYMEAKKEYLSAKNIYQGLGKEDKTTEVGGKIELLEAMIEQAAALSEGQAGEDGQGEANPGGVGDGSDTGQDESSAATGEAGPGVNLP